MNDPGLLPRLLCVVMLLFVAATGATAQAAPKFPAAPGTAPDEQIYRNATFGIRYTVPFGWVERTREMRKQAAENPEPDATSGAKEDSAALPDAGSRSSNPKASSSAHGANKSAGTLPSEVLLAVFERPPEAAGENVNSAVVIASEPATSYPGLKKAQDFLAPLGELTAAQGFKPEGEPSIVEVDGRELVRANFAKELTDKLSMHQSTLALLAKGQIVSFTFIAGSEDEVDELIERLSFTARPSGAKARQRDEQ